jgi:hypothetical protein
MPASMSGCDGAALTPSVAAITPCTSAASDADGALGFTAGCATAAVAASTECLRAKGVRPRLAGAAA